MRNNRQVKKQHNQGFSLFTVIIAVSFVGILGLLILYIALSNFQMKVTDLKGKDSFYTAERALEEIRTGLQEDVGNAMSKAYTQVLEAYNKDSSSTDASMDKLRQADFEKKYISELVSRLQAGNNQNYYSLDHLRGYVDLKIDESQESLIITNPSGTSSELRAVQAAGKNSGESGVLLKNLKVIYVDPKGRAAVIRTDIFLKVPAVEFPTPSTLPDLMNMIVVADKGIICKGTQEQPSTIQGSIYAGLIPAEQISNTENTSIWIDSGASLSIDAGDKVVCKGEINVGQNSSFKSETGVNLWGQGLNADSVQNVSLLGTTYVADDLTINGKNNNVKIAGNYYGFGSSDSALDDACHFKDLYSAAQMNGADLSSAIVVNGKNTTLDLSEAQKVMIAGRNYIASSKINTPNGTTNKNDIITGESITVKGTQLAYLVPSELLGNKGNPMSYNDYLEWMNPSQNGTLMVDRTTPVEAWGGRSLSEIGVDTNEPVQTVFYNDNASGGHVYFYLNFTDEQNAADFMQMYYQNNPAIKQNMDRYLSFYFNQDGNGINIKDSDSYLRYVTNGNALSYDGASGEGNLQEATDTATEDNVIQEQIGYQNSWYTLNRKMISSYDLMNTEVKEDEQGHVHDETDSSRSVFDNLVNEKKMVEYIQKKGDAGNTAANLWKYVFTADKDADGLQAIMYHNGESSTFEEKDENGTVTSTETIAGANETLEINSELAKNLRLVVCTGDVTIKSGVEFKGIIMAKGTITLEAGAKLESSPLEAARVFQAQMNSQEDGESMKPQDFFWEGDKYVLGNSTTSGSGNNLNGSTTYNIADCVTYQNWKKQ